MAKMDATTNDIPLGVDLELKGFPTIVLFKADTNVIVSFEGSRDLAGLQSFLSTTAVHGNQVKDAPAASVEKEEEEEEDDRDEL